MPKKDSSPFSARKRLIVVAISACFASAPAWGNPTAPQVVNGAASFNQAGKLLTVTNSNGAIINWNSFSIGANETTRFNQASAASSVLNRVIANDPSVLLGTLSSNGKVWLVNPAGIMVGQGARIDVAGFIASTLSVRNEDFLAGRLNFGATPDAGSIRNYGQITTPSGGSIYLVAPEVENHGIINAPNGEVILAAGQTAQLIDTGTPGVKVDITGAEGNVTNLGEIVAEAGRIGMAGVLVRNSGALNASSVVREGGRIFLKASQDAYVDGAGRIVTTGTKGGSVEVLGNRVAVMDQAQMDASGNTGGGQILVGGDYQGKNPEVQNASVTYFGPQASLKADATRSGDGGKVIVWADDTTRAFGTISAKGGTQSGNGGFVETSGHHLETAGIRVDASAPRGQGGSWLLDPNDIQIVNGDGSDANVSNAGGIWNTSSDSAVVYGGNIAAALNGGTSVEIKTGVASPDTQYGDIAMSGVTLDVAPPKDTSLTLKAHRNIVISGSSMSSTGHKLGVTLNAHYADDAAQGNVQIYDSSINTNGGAVVIGGGAEPKLTPAMGYYGGSVNERSGVYIDSATITTYGGTLNITGTGFGSGSGNYGIYIHNSTLDTRSSDASTGGAVTLTGTGGNGYNDNFGVYLHRDYGYVEETIKTGGGALNITGTGSGAGNGNYGIYSNETLDTTKSDSSTGGDVTLTGTGGNGGSDNYGVYLDGGEGGNTRTGGGALTIVGTGGGTGGSNAGIYTEHDAELDTSRLDGGTGGKISLKGTGSNGTDLNNRGVYLNYGTSVKSGGGALDIIGVGGDGGEGRGIDIYNATLDTSGGSVGGALTLNGTGGNGSTWNIGVRLDDSLVTTGGGTLEIIGRGGGTGSDNYGIDVSSGTKLDTSKGDGAGGGDVTLTGTGSIASDSGSHGVRLDSSEIFSARNLTVIGHAGAGDDSSDIYVSGSVVLRADSDGTGVGTVGFGSVSVQISAESHADIYYNPNSYAVADPTSSDSSHNPYSARISGSGTYTAWMLVNHVGQVYGGAVGLQAMNTNLAGNYALGKNIDASPTSGWNSGAGFLPVGNSSALFTGNFDGLGNTIDKLVLNYPGGTYIGLFGSTGPGANVQNVGLVGGSVKGDLFVGGLIGYNYQATVSNSYSTSSVSGSGDVGGLVGINNGTVSSSYATGSVNGTGSNIGGLVGYNLGTVSNSYATGNTTGFSSVGGLVGYNENASISHSYATGSVSGTGAIVGGLVGFNAGTVSSSFWDTETTGRSAGIGGGNDSGAMPLSTTEAMLEGSYDGWDFSNTWWLSDGNTRPFLRSEWSTAINNAHQLQLMAMDASADYSLMRDIDMSELSSSPGMWDTTKGFVPISGYSGRFDGAGNTVDGLYINRSAESYVGLFGTINSTGVVTNVGLVGGHVTGADYVGGLVGENRGKITDAYNTGTVTGSGDKVGGLAGRNRADYGVGIIRNSYSTGPVSGTVRVGGLVGYNTGEISNSFSRGAVDGQSAVGGLVGRNSDTGIVSGAYSVGSVSGDFSVGGLIGQNSGGVKNVYATGAVSGDHSLGGLVGSNDSGSNSDTGNIIYAYSTGSVSGAGADVGGLIGYSIGTVGDSYWDKDVSGLSTSNGGIGKSTAEMNQLATFSGWSMASTGGSNAIWRIYEGATTPLLRSFLKSIIVTANDASKVYDKLAFGGNGVTYSVADATLSGVPSYTGTSMSAVNVGSYSINATGLYSDQQGYDISYAPGTLNITARPLTVTADAKSKVYGEADPTLTYSVGATASSTGLVSGDSLGGSLARTAGEAVLGGPYAINQGSLSAGSNYALSYTGANLAITPRRFTVTADAKSKVYGEADPALTYAVGATASGTGLVSGDSLGGSLTRTAGETVLGGPYAINQGNLSAGSNYALSYTGANLAITTRPRSTWIGGSIGDWSVASNWDALPFLSNVLEVTIPTGTTVTYDAATGSTNLTSLAAGGLNMAGGTLNITDKLTADGLNITGGSLTIANSLTVNSSFSQSGGTLGDFGAGSSANITQATGDLDLPAITVTDLRLRALAGAITQSGPITALTLNTQSQGATTLTNPDNQVSGRVDMTAGGPLKLWASGDLTLGVIDAGANEVEIKAGGAILQALGTETSTNIIASLANLTSVFGGASGGLAINTNTQITGALTATVGAEADFGGIRIQNSGVQPASVTLVDNALAQAGVSFLNTGNIGSTSGYTLQTRTGGDLALLSNGNLTWDGGSLATPSGSVQISADGSLDITGALSSPVDLALSSTNSINVSGSVITQGTGTAAFTAPSVAINGSVDAADDVGIIANTIDFGAGSSTAAGHDVILAAANVTATNASVAADHDISAAVTGELRLNGSGFTAGNDIFINMLGASSTLYLNDTAGLPPAFLWAQAPSTIHVAFPARTSGGLVVDGVAVDPLKFVTAAGGSGLFFGAAKAPATIGAGLELSYADGTAVPDTSSAEPTVIDAVVAAISAVITPATQTNEPQPSPTIDLNALPSTAAGGTSGADDGTGGSEGTFGAANGSENGEEEDKDKNKKDEETGLKKQADKPAAKKLSTCS